MLTGPQIRAARALLEWDASTLAGKSGLTDTGILKIERGEVAPKEKTTRKLFDAFDAAGIEFLDNEGVRRRPTGLEVFDGPARFHDFTALVLEHAKMKGGIIRILAGDERLFLKYRKDPVEYRETMLDMKQRNWATVRILAEQSSFNSSFAEMRKVSHKQISSCSFYIFGDNFALISFADKNPPHVTLHRGGPFAAAFSQWFDDLWNKAEIPNVQ